MRSTDAAHLDNHITQRRESLTELWHASCVHNATETYTQHHSPDEAVADVVTWIKSGDKGSSLGMT